MVVTLPALHIAGSVPLHQVLRQKQQTKVVQCEVQLMHHDTLACTLHLEVTNTGQFVNQRVIDLYNHKASTKHVYRGVPDLIGTFQCDAGGARESVREYDPSKAHRILQYKTRRDVRACPHQSASLSPVRIKAAPAACELDLHQTLHSRAKQIDVRQGEHIFI